MKHSLPETGFLRLERILGNPKKEIPALIPVSKSHWWQGVKDGKYPRSYKLSERCTVWRVEDIRDLINREGKQNQDVI